jgi:hypothetical protein
VEIQRKYSKFKKKNDFNKINIRNTWDNRRKVGDNLTPLDAVKFASRMEPG